MRAFQYQTSDGGKYRFIIADFLNHSISLSNQLPAPVFMTIYQQADPA
jgi:hypothetical protein